MAVSNRSGSQNLTVTRASHGVGNSLASGSLPGWQLRAREHPEQVQVELVTLNEVLRHERDGVYLLKIDSQGHEYQILQGCAQYMRTHPVYMVFFEYFPKGLHAHGTNGMDLLELLRHLGYTCFNAGGKGTPEVGALSFEEFISKYPVPRGRLGFGGFTDLACIRLDLL